MRTVHVTRSFPATVHEAETCWYDTRGWPAWVDGFGRVLELHGDWPRAGASVTWESGPAGRGRVRERVMAHEPLAGQTLQVEDDSVRARQTVAFTPTDNGVEIELSLEYELLRRSIFTAIVDLLFIRRAMENSLRATLERFGLVLSDRRER